MACLFFFIKRKQLVSLGLVRRLKFEFSCYIMRKFFGFPPNSLRKKIRFVLGLLDGYITHASISQHTLSPLRHPSDGVTNKNE